MWTIHLGGSIFDEENISNDSTPGKYAFEVKIPKTSE
jgi:hypothetical protein